MKHTRLKAVTDKSPETHNWSFSEFVPVELLCRKKFLVVVLIDKLKCIFRFIKGRGIHETISCEKLKYSLRPNPLPANQSINNYENN